MKARDRANALMDELRDRTFWTEELSLMIEQAITAAEVDAKIAGAEEEREACARIADIAAGALSLNDPGHLDRVEALKAIATEIRARQSKGD